MFLEKVIQVGFKNIAFVLGISIVLDINNLVLRSRKKPNTISISAKITRVLFGENEYRKDLWILEFFDAYNHEINYIDKADQLFAYNPGLRYYHRGG
jgi:hypothetical protein